MSQPIKIAINGFGRIGRVITRLAARDHRIQVAGINDLADLHSLAHLLKYDSAHGTLDAEVRVDGKNLVVGGSVIPCSAERDPSALPWKSLEIDMVHECTGIFTAHEKASLHLKAGAQKVIVSAPSKDPDATFVMGVNHQDYDPAKHHIVSNASCTTNCLAPVAQVLDQKFGITRGSMTTVHSYTNDQRTLDQDHKDLRRARAAAVSQIPTTTGAARAVGLVLPQLKGKLDGFAIRVPTPNVSLVDLTVELQKKTSAEEINSFLKTASEGEMKGILGYSDEPLVSIDYNGCTHSSTVDSLLTSVIDGNFAKVVAWYDNEAGFSQRMIDLTHYMAQKA